jgi:sortase A
MTRKRWIALLTALAIVLAAAITTASVSFNHRSSGDDSPWLAEPVTTTTKQVTTTTHKATTTTAASTLPQPQPAPSDPYAPTPLVQLGTIQIPKIGEVSPVYEGITLTVINNGPGHWPGSAMPCQVGNSVFPGHRVTHTHPFLNLDLLNPGDQIVFHMPGHDCVYAVTGTQIVRPTDVWVIDPTPTATVSLIACHPKHSAAQRIVVKGKLIGDIKT